MPVGPIQVWGSAGTTADPPTALDPEPAYRSRPIAHDLAVLARRRDQLALRAAKFDRVFAQDPTSAGWLGRECHFAPAPCRRRTWTELVL